MTTPWRYLIIDDEGEVSGTCDFELAEHVSNEGTLVIDTKNSKYLHDLTDVPQTLAELPVDDEEDDE